MFSIYETRINLHIKLPKNQDRPEQKKYANVRNGII